MKRWLWLFSLLLITISPPARAQSTSGNITAANSACQPANCVALVVNGDAASAAISITGTFSGTEQFEVVTIDGQAGSVTCFPPNSTTGVTSATGVGQWKCDVSGMQQVRVRGSAYTSGTAAVSINATKAISTDTLGMGGGGGGGSGTVTSVSLTVPSWLNNSTPTITVSGTFGVTPATGQTPHQVIGTCGSGTTFVPCALVAGDLPTIPSTQISGLAASATTDTTNASNISSGTLPCGRMPALTGDVTSTVNTCTATVTAINGLSFPASAKLIGSNSSSQPIAAALTSAHIYVGNASNLPADVALSGDATLSNTGALTLANTAVTPGSCGDTTHSCSITADSKGRITALTNNSISAGSTTLDLVGGAAAQATLTEAAAGDKITFAGVETAALTYPYTFTNNSASNNSSGALILNTTGAGTGQVPLVINESTAAGDILDMYTGGTVTNGVLSGGTLQASIGKTGTFASASGIYTSIGNIATQITTAGTNKNVTITPTGTGTTQIGTGGAGANSLTVKGFASQTGDLLDLDNNTPTVLTSFGPAATITKYNGTATVNNGVPSEIAKLALTAQSAAITTTNLIASLPSTDTYKVHFVLKVTTPGTSSVLGGTTGVVIGYTDGGDSVAQSYTMACSSQAGLIITVASGNTGNTTTTVSSCDLYFFAKTGTAVTYAVGYSSTGTTMQYEVNATLLAD